MSDFNQLSAGFEHILPMSPMVMPDITHNLDLYSPAGSNRWLSLPVNDNKKARVVFAAGLTIHDINVFHSRPDGHILTGSSFGQQE